jgi:hypothetical protein
VRAKLQDSWFISSVQLFQAQIRSAPLIEAQIDNSLRYGVSYLPEIDLIKLDEIIKQFDRLVEVSREHAVSADPPLPMASVGGGALKQFTPLPDQKGKQRCAGIGIWK